jgi:hypothetical protein
VGTEIFFGKPEIRLDNPADKPPDGKSLALEASVNHAVLCDTRSNRTFAQCLGHVAETIERQLQAFDNLGGPARFPAGSV